MPTTNEQSLRVAELALKLLIERVAADGRVCVSGMAFESLASQIPLRDSLAAAEANLATERDRA